MDFLKKIDGFKTMLAIVAGGLLTIVYGLDLQLHDNPQTDMIEVVWLSTAAYERLATLIATVGGVTFMMKLNKIGGANKLANEWNK